MKIKRNFFLTIKMDPRIFQKRLEQVKFLKMSIENKYDFFTITNGIISRFQNSPSIIKPSLEEFKRLKLALQLLNMPDVREVDESEIIQLTKTLLSYIDASIDKRQRLIKVSQSQLPPVDLNIIDLINIKFKFELYHRNDVATTSPQAVFINRSLELLNQRQAMVTEDNITNFLLTRFHRSRREVTNLYAKIVIYLYRNLLGIKQRKDPQIENWIFSCYNLLLANINSNITGNFKIIQFLPILKLSLWGEFSSYISKILFLIYYTPSIWQLKQV